MEEMKVLKFRKKLNTFPLNRCPNCSSLDVVKGPIRVEGEEILTDDFGYPANKRVYNEVQECTCNACSKKYMLDFGRSTYIVYEKPYHLTCMSDIFCLADFESEWHDNFSILMATSPTKRPKYYYYISYEEDRHPIFITRVRAKEFIKDYKKVKPFVRNTWMSRYR